MKKMQPKCSKVIKNWKKPTVLLLANHEVKGSNKTYTSLAYGEGHYIGPSQGSNIITRTVRGAILHGVPAAPSRLNRSYGPS